MANNISRPMDTEYVTVAQTGERTIKRKIERDPSYWWDGFSAGAATLLLAEFALFILIMSLLSKGGN